MKARRYGKTFGGAAACLFLALLATAGIDRGGITFGAVTRTDQLVVHGISYDTTNAEIIVDGSPGTLEQIATGQVVSVNGPVTVETGAGVAISVEFADTVEGPIQLLDVPAGKLTVLGQPVRVTDTTVFYLPPEPQAAPGPTVPLARGGFAAERWTLDSLGIGDQVEVSGFVDAEGTTLATHVAVVRARTLEATGRVENLDAGDEHFKINDLVVDYSGAELIGFDGELTNGDNVEAQGFALGASNELVAAFVYRRAEGVTSEPGNGTILEGFVTSFQSILDFAVGGTDLTVNAQTQFVGGTPGDLDLDDRLLVEGDFDEQGRVHAFRVTFLDDDDDDLLARYRRLFATWLRTAAVAPAVTADPAAAVPRR